MEPEKSEPDMYLASPNTTSSACEKWKATDEPDTINYSAELRASEKGRTKDEPNAICYSATTTRCDELRRRTSPTPSATDEPDVLSPCATTTSPDELRRRTSPMPSATDQTIAPVEKMEPYVKPGATRQTGGACGRREAKLEPSMSMPPPPKIEACEKREDKLEPSIVPSSSYSSYHLVAAAGSACASWVMWKARAAIADKWLGGGEALEPKRKGTSKSKPAAISYSTGSEASHKRWLERKLGKESARSTV
mmetsp:Transcript_56263/g.150121  ORF Transcript_56263/g.150121 Transcript_56263/m.150121 type:complete len:251 (-) Transcript_56263:126-878(-)